MNDVIAYLQGKKTYFTVAIAILYIVGAYLGFWDLSDEVLAVFGLGALAFLRAGIRKGDPQADKSAMARFPAIFFGAALLLGLSCVAPETTATPLAGVSLPRSEMPPLPPSPMSTSLPDQPKGLAAFVKLEPDPAKIFTITWTNLPPAYTNGYQIHATQDLADGWRIVGSSTSDMDSISYRTRTGPNTSFYRLEPLIGDGASPVYILQWQHGEPEIVVWEPPPVDDPDPEPVPAIEITIAPTDDAYLQAGTRFNDQWLKVEGTNRVSYLRFNVTGIDGTVISAALRLRENGDPGEGVIRAWRGSHDDWTETTLTAAKAPAKTVEMGMRQGAVGTGQEITIDLGANIATNGVYTVVLEQDTGGNDVWFGSMECANPPSLLLVVY